MEQRGYIYILTNSTNKVLYTGVTNSLIKRIKEHKQGQGSLFTSKYKCDKLVYFEVLPDIVKAILREKQIKHYKREWKDNIITEFNKDWKDLYPGLIDDPIMV